MPRPPTPNPGLVCGCTVKNGENAGKPCSLRAGFGTKHVGFGPCRKHGGNQPLVSAKWEAESRNWEATRAMATYGTPRQIDPLTGLKEELWRTAGIVQWLETQIGELSENEITHLVVTNADRAEEDGRKLEVIDERANELVNLFQKERKHYLEVCKTCISVGLAQMEIEMAQQQAAIFNGTLRGTLVELGVDIRDPRVLAVVRKHLSAAAVAISAAA